MRCDVFLMGGSRSARPLRRSLDALAARLPAAKRVRLPRAGHTAAANDGRPAKVARHLKAFFAAPRGER